MFFNESEIKRDICNGITVIIFISLTLQRVKCV